jgi:hypothetical protein
MQPVTRHAIYATAAALLSCQLVVEAQPVAYPAKGQSPQHQQQDHAACASWARSNTGVDPATVATTAPPSGPAVGGGERVGGAARGAARATISATRRPRPRPRARMQWPHSIRHIPPVCAAAGTRCKRAASHATAQAVRLKAPRMDIETRRCKPRFASSRCNSRCRFEMCSFAGRVINASPVRRVADASRRDAASYRGLPCGHSCWYQRSTWRCAAWRLVG